MHYHWQILVKADSKDEALSQLDSVMDEIGGDGAVWDYWGIDENWSKGSKIVRATSKTFLNRLEQALDSQKKELLWSIEQLQKELDKKGLSLADYVYNPVIEESDFMTHYYLSNIASIRGGNYISSSFFGTSGEIWGSSQFTKEVEAKVQSNPKEYWLISVDIHN